MGFPSWTVANNLVLSCHLVNNYCLMKKLERRRAVLVIIIIMYPGYLQI